MSRALSEVSAQPRSTAGAHAARASAEADAFGYAYSNQPQDVAFTMPHFRAAGNTASQPGVIAVLCDAELGYSELNAEIAATAARELRRSIAESSRKVNFEASLQHVLHRAQTAAERQVERLTGRRSSGDAISILLIVVDADIMTIARLGSCRLWLRRSNRLSTIISMPTSVIGVSSHALQAYDRLLLATGFVSDCVMPSEINTLLDAQPSNAAVVRTLVERASETGLPQIASAICVTHGVVPPMRALVPLSPARRAAAEEDDELHDEVTEYAARSGVPSASLALISVMVITMLALIAMLAFMSGQPMRTTDPGPLSTPAPEPDQTVMPTAPIAPIVLPPTITPLP
jgi:serine/threonine protein phosphatase PrpC